MKVMTARDLALERADTRRNTAVAAAVARLASRQSIARWAYAQEVAAAEDEHAAFVARMTRIEQHTPEGS